MKMFRRFADGNRLRGQRCQGVLAAAELTQRHSWVLSLIAGAVTTLPGSVRADEPPLQVFDPEPTHAQTVARTKPLLGAGHASILELSLGDTQTNRISHSLAIGAFGAMSAISESPDARAHSAQVARFVLDWHVGGGQSGFDGALRADFGHGVRWPAIGHGVFLRGGADAKVAGNRQYYWSSLNAPNADIGYQYMGYGKLVELSFRASLLWDGRFRIDDTTSKNLPTTISWGGLFEAGTPWLWTSLQFTRAAGLSLADADICTQPAPVASLCLRVAQGVAGASWDDPRQRLTVGTVGLGFSIPSG